MIGKVSATQGLRLVNVGALAALLGVLCIRPERLSLSHVVALCLGGVAFVAALAALFDRNPLARLVRLPALSRPVVRTVCAIAPWAALCLATSVMGLWWIQRPWEPKLLVVYALAGWSWVWLTAGREAPGPAGPGEEGATGTDVDRSVRRTLLGLACLLALLGADGLVLGRISYGVQASAWLALGGAAIAAITQSAGPAGRGRLLSACFGLALGLACVEAGIRMLHLGGNVREVDSSAIARQFYSMTPPGSTFVNWPKTLDEFEPALIEINSTGIRGPEIRPGPVDLLLIGDSMIEARQLPWEQTLGPRLQAALDGRSSRARVVSHGMRGWSPLLEWNWYLKVGRTLRPRIVLLFFFWNDLWASGDEVRTFRAVMSPDGRPDHFEVAVDSRWVWYKHVRTVRVTADMVQRVGVTTIRRAVAMIGTTPTGGQDLAGARALAKRMAGDGLLTESQLDALLSKPFAELDQTLQRLASLQLWGGLRPFRLWTDTQRTAAAATELTLQRFAEDVAKDGARLAVVYVPNAYQIATSECSVARYLDGLDDGVLLPVDSGIQTWLAGATARHGIELLDPSDAMRRLLQTRPAGSPPLYLRADCHWAERGHQFVADYLADWYLGLRPPAR